MHNKKYTVLVTDINSKSNVDTVLTNDYYSNLYIWYKTS